MNNTSLETFVNNICRLLEFVSSGYNIIVDVGGKVWDEYVKIVREAYREPGKLPVLIVKKPVIVTYMFYKKPDIILNEYLKMDSLLVNEDSVLNVVGKGLVTMTIIEKEAEDVFISYITQAAKLYVEEYADVVNGDARLLEKVAENPVVENIVLKETSIPETESYMKICAEDMEEIREKISSFLENRNIEFSRETVVSLKSAYSHRDYEKIRIGLYHFRAIDVSFDSSLESNDCSMIRKHLIDIAGEMANLIVKQIIRYAEVFT